MKSNEAILWEMLQLGEENLIKIKKNVKKQSNYMDRSLIIIFGSSLQQPVLIWIAYQVVI